MKTNIMKSIDCFPPEMEYGFTMTNQKLVVFTVLVASYVSEVLAHGKLMDPVNRGSAWRLGFNTPINYDDNANYCGGAYIHHQINNGRCGACGDNFQDAIPRANENGGLYGTGVIVKNYIEGQVFVVTVKITANHQGHFEFSLCPLDDRNSVETEECFDNHRILTFDGQTKWILPSSEPQDFEVRLVLPQGFTCNHCSLRWHYRAANSWGVCDDLTEGLGCGPQETFRTCSDISIKRI